MYFGKFHTVCKQSAFAIRLKSRQWIFRTCLLRLGRSKGHLKYHLNIYNKKETSLNWRGTWEIIAELSKLTWIFCVCGYSETFQILIALVRYYQSFIFPHCKIRTWNLPFHSLSIEGKKSKIWNKNVTGVCDYHITIQVTFSTHAPKHAQGSSYCLQVVLKIIVIF